jgi:hypothetical protein
VFEAETDVKIFPKAATGNIKRAYFDNSSDYQYFRNVKSLVSTDLTDV